MVIRVNTDASYQLAEQRATKYYHSLFNQVMKKTYVSVLINDLQTWKQNHIHRYKLPFFKKSLRPDQKDYYPYIKWLELTGKLDSYLDRSISYIFMRDLGKALDSDETQKKITMTVENFKKQLVSSDQNQDFNMVWLYRWAQKERIESAVIWLFDKLNIVSANIPEGLDADHAQRKLLKIIAGVTMHMLEEMDENTPQDERTKKLEQAIKLGYSYGLTYPFIDDLLDANVLDGNEKSKFSQLIRTTLVTGSVPDLGNNWTRDNQKFIQFVHSELREAFEYIKRTQPPMMRKYFLEQAYVFFQSQEVDRTKDLSHSYYSNEEIFLPLILKSASSRLIARSIISAPLDEAFDERTFVYGIYNQLADDFADMFDDMREGAVTPYTYFWKYHNQRQDLINPFELYWTVIVHLIHHVYGGDFKTREVILDRAINGLKRFKERHGVNQYNKVMELFTLGNKELNNLIQVMVQKADDVDFFDKLLRDQMITTLRKERNEREEFIRTVKEVRKYINDHLNIKDQNSLKGPIIKAANYSLDGDGKRLRPIMTWMLAKEYGLKDNSIVPLLKSLEYMHTASLIFDDLPSQDNAGFRRGRTTLHQLFNVATAELTGLFLTQKAIEEQASLEQFDAKSVLHLIKYSARVTMEMCQGQLMDLEAKGARLTLEELMSMCYYKTGIAFEASLIMPAILAGVEERELNALKRFALHTGTAFQIKDDLLDAEGDEKLLGKPTGTDAEYNRSTFVTELGIEKAKILMWDHYCLAMDEINRLGKNNSFFKHLLDYIVNRER